jgi:hypothetical protein
MRFKLMAKLYIVRVCPVIGAALLAFFYTNPLCFILSNRFLPDSCMPSPALQTADPEDP